MSLEIYLLGQFKLQAGNLPIELPSRPAQSLLAYLALNPGVSHRREALACLLWPDASDTNARSYLRQALWRIRKALESAALDWEQFLQVSDISISLNERSGYWLDADQLLQPTEARSSQEMMATLRLYRGDLLPGLYDEWVVLERERLQAAYHHKMNQLLDCLSQSGQWDELLEWAEQWIRRGYAPEPAYRALMTAHAGLGDLGMVSASYRRCVEALERELGLEPSSETSRLYERLLSGELEPAPHPAPKPSIPAEHTPPFLDSDQPHPVEQPLFVAREPELAQLDGYLGQALGGHGRVAFITGEAGSGKTALLQEFAQHAQLAHQDLVVASGNCNAHTGLGDPYLPFREILAQLSGEVEARWAAGAITTQHARRLWDTLPLTAQALAEAGPDLIDTFVPGSILLQRAHAAAPEGAEWLTRLNRLVDHKASAELIYNPQQSDLFVQYTRVLQALARSLVLVIVIDDLQWADLGSFSLLFHLGRNLAGCRIMIIGAYRPEEVAMGRDGARHPLEPLVNEFKRAFGDITINMDVAERRAFVDELLDCEPNQLGQPFRNMLFQQTRGYPLFTIELLRGMQERGDLVLDPDGLWTEGPTLDWETLPARVEAVVAERISRLAEPLRKALRVASVEGETFTAEVVARATAINDRQLLGKLSAELDRKHRLISAHSIQRIGAHLLSCYRFRHILTQRYIYASLNEVERVYIHEDVGNALEQLYGDQAGDIAVRLAWHFQEARSVERAIHYLHLAGEKAVHLSAYQEGIAHLTKCLDLLLTLPESPERDQQELDLQLALGMAWMRSSSPFIESKKALTRARELCLITGQTTKLWRILGELSIYHFVRAEYPRVLQFQEEALRLAEEVQDPMQIGMAHWYLGFVSFTHADYTKARTHLHELISIYDPEKHHESMITLRGSDPALSALSYEVCCLWCLGYPDQAARMGEETIALAYRLGHGFSLADVLSFSGCMLNAMSREPELLKQASEEVIRLSNQMGFTGWKATSTVYLGLAMVQLGSPQDGLALMEDGIATNKSMDVYLYMPGYLGYLAEAQAASGQFELGLSTLDEALEIAAKNDERHWESDLYCKQGKLLLMQSDETGAEASFQKAISVAKGQNAKSWELQASIELARLWGSQGKLNEARQMLGEIFAWFTEGFDTYNLKAAKVLLDELSSG